MAKRIYSETVKKWARNLGLVGGTLIGLIFMYLYAIGAISNVSYSKDVICAGTIEDPCEAYINFTANEDIFIYPTNYDPWGRNTPFNFNPNVKEWKLYRSWGNGWREIKLNQTCTGTWCGLSNKDDTRKFAYAFREGRDYQLKVVAYKNNPKDDIKWGVFSGVDEIDPYWYGLPEENISFLKVKIADRWKVIDATGEYDTYISNSSDKKTHLGWYLKDGINPANANLSDKYLYDCNGNTILDNKGKPIKLKYETNKVPCSRESDGLCDGYFIKLTDASAVNINNCVTINPRIVYQEESMVQFQKDGLIINNTLRKWNGEEFVIAPEDIWIREPDELNFKFGANDTIAKENTLYQYEWISNKPIGFDDKEKKYYFEKEFSHEDLDNKYFQIIWNNVSDICTEEANCSFQLVNHYKNINFENETNKSFDYAQLILNFTGFYNATVDMVFIDPAYSVTEYSANNYLASGNNRTYKPLSVNLGSDNRANFTINANNPANGTIYYTNLNDNSNPSTAYINTDPNLVGYWHLDNWGSYGETSTHIYDFSGNGNDGTAYNGASPTSSGKYNGGFYFDGSNDYISIPDDPSLDGFTNGFTAIAWIKPEDISSRASILHKYDTGGAGERAWFLEIYNSDMLESFFSSNGDTYVADRFENNLVLGSFQQIALVWQSNQNPVLYVNGVVQTRIESSGTVSSIYNSAAPFEIGRSTYSPTRAFKGTIDEVMIFNRSLSADEIKSIYITGSLNHKNDGVGINWTESSTGFQTLNATGYEIPTSSSHLMPEITTSTSTSVTNITLFTYIAPSADTCTYTSGDWNVDCSDNCLITSNVNLGGNDLIFTNSGKFTLQTNVNITNIGSIQLSNGCEIILNDKSYIIL